jgi:hypothetical protein
MPIGDQSPLNSVFGAKLSDYLNKPNGYILPPNPSTDSEQLNRIEEKLDSLHQKLDLIFGGNVLIDGKFVDLKELIRVVK